MKLNFVKCGLAVLILLFILLYICSRSLVSNTPNKSEMEIALHARMMNMEEDFMEVIITENGVDENVTYTVSVKNCKFYIERNTISENYPILIIPKDAFEPSDTSLVALKIYGLSN